MEVPLNLFGTSRLYALVDLTEELLVVPRVERHLGQRTAVKAPQFLRVGKHENG